MKLILETNDKDLWETEICEKLCEQTENGCYVVPHGNAGLDIVMPVSVTVPVAQKNFKLHLGVKIKSSGHTMLCLRSSAPKIGIRQSNSVGIVDRGYRGELILCFDNVMMKSVTIPKGKRVCQLVALDGSQIEFEFGKVGNDTSRGEGGFGSTDAIVAEKIQTI